MKILTVSNYYPPHFIGGYEIACKDTMDFLKSQGHEVLVLTSDFHKNNATADDALRELRLINYSTTSRLKKYRDEYYNYKKVSKLIKKMQPDLIYFWSLRGLGVELIKAADEQNIPKVYEIGDFWMYGYMQGGLRRKLQNLLPFITPKRLDISPAICVSEWVAKEMKELYHSNTTHVYPNATTVPKEIAPETEQIRFIFSGRIDEEKGLDLAITALSKFARKYPKSPFTFDIYGDGDKKYINKCKELATPIDSSVHFKGKVHSKEEMYAGATVLLMPTRMREPFGLVIIEAMAHGCIVLATDAYGPAEIVDKGDNGLLFNMEDKNDLLCKIEQLYFNQELRRKLRDNAYEHVTKNYSITKVKPKVETLLKKIARVAS